MAVKYMVMSQSTCGSGEIEKFSGAPQQLWSPASLPVVSIQLPLTSALAGFSLVWPSSAAVVRRLGCPGRRPVT